MTLIAENTLFFSYTGAAFLIVMIAHLWGDHSKISGSLLFMGSIILSNIFYRLAVMQVITVDLLNLFYALIDIFLVWVYVTILRDVKPYDRKYWARILAGIHLIMLATNLIGAASERFAYSPVYSVVLNALTIIALIACLIGFIPMERSKFIAMIYVKWMYFKADILDNIWRYRFNKVVISVPSEKAKFASQALQSEIGARMRQARIERGKTMEEVAEYLGVTKAQVQKYETGASRIPADALFHLSGFLDTDVRFFYSKLKVELPVGMQTAPAKL